MGLYRRVHFSKGDAVESVEFAVNVESACTGEILAHTNSLERNVGN